MRNKEILTILKYVALLSKLEKTVADLQKEIDELVFEKGDKLGQLESIKNEIAESSLTFYATFRVFQSRYRDCNVNDPSRLMSLALNLRSL